THAMEIEEDDLEDSSAQAERVLAALALIAENSYASMRFRLVEDAWFREEIDHEGDITDVTLMLDDGTQPELEIEAEELEILIDPAGFTVHSAGDDLVRSLLEQGFVDPF
ncbi:MAG TPA: hypothetical protein VGL84_05830, partial [Gaiellaceae bacterium]